MNLILIINFNIMDRNYDLDPRTIKFAGKIITFCNSIPNNFAGLHLKGQLIKSGTSPALNYGEAQGAESKNDFIHKMGICLKELRESKNCLKVLHEVKYGDENLRLELLQESIELTRIFASIIVKTRNNRGNNPKN
ncbi:four helix bundle protein [Shivajiella indica]|uniref:Four helix bundle protein n=1 Tax=Shivajiella indica TaxID=872115 RepID=A0ABW5BBF8_9BACT